MERPKNENRVGKFFISRRFVLEWKDLLPIFSKVVIVSASFTYDKDGFEYVGLSEYFDINPVGYEAPLYTFIMHQNQAGVVDVKSVERVI